MYNKLIITDNFYFFQDHELGETDILSHGVSGLSLHRSESLNQRPLSLKRTGSKGSAYSLRSIRKEMPKSSQAEKPPTIPDSGFGTLEIKLAYDNGTSSLAVTVLRARALIGMDMTGLSDPFCRLEILPRGEKCFRLADATSLTCPLFLGSSKNS